MKTIFKKIGGVITLSFIAVSCSSDDSGSGNQGELPTGEIVELVKQFDISSITSENNMHAAALQNDGKIIIATDKIYRLNPDGSIDNSFNADSSLPSGINCKIIVLQNDDKILLGYSNNGTAQVLFRLNANGSLDHSFTPDIKGELATSSREVNSILPLNDGGVIFGGTFAKVDNVSYRYHLSRLNNSGRLVESFNPRTYPNIANNVATISQLPNNRFLVTGALFTNETAGAIPRANAIVMDYNGNVDASFNFTEDLWVQHPVADLKRIYAVASVSDGSFLFGGNFNSLMEISSSGNKVKEIAFEENYRKINSIASIDNNTFLIGSGVTGLPIGYLNYDKFFSVYSKSENTIKNFSFGFEDGLIRQIIKESEDSFLLFGRFKKANSGEIVNILRIKTQ